MLNKVKLLIILIFFFSFSEFLKPQDIPIISYDEIKIELDETEIKIM
jgi:hypothetical protein